MKVRYLSEVLPVETFAHWVNGKKILIEAPTGTGKNYFTLNVFAPFCRRKGKRIAILCNRKLLREQYSFDLAEQYSRYTEMKDSIILLTYQQLSERLKSGLEIDSILKNVDVVVCDEAHYFYSDADFNSLGTYVLLQALVKAAFYKTMIFMTATLKEVLPLLERTLIQFQTQMELENPFADFSDYKYIYEIFSFNYLADFSRFKCYFSLDMESLAAEIAKSEKKSVIFIDDTCKASQFRGHLIKNHKIPADEIYLLSSESLEEKANQLFVHEISVGNKLPTRILLTTSVLDNGVSIKDPEVGNIVIATESRVSFLQMVGRIRSECTEQCRLFIYPRKRDYYEKRVLQYTQKVEAFEKIEQKSLRDESFGIISSGWYGNDEYAEFLRNAVVYTTNENEFYQRDFLKNYWIKNPNPIVAVNCFAKEKVGNLLQAEMKFLRLSYSNDVAAVAREQIKWLEKAPEELIVLDSTFLETREVDLKKRLLEIKGFNNEELQEAKKDIANEFRLDILAEMNLKNSSFATDKLSKICEKYGLILEKGKDEKGKTTYSVRNKI